MVEKVNIIPFGKHRGEPVEILLADRQYVEWLLLQPWFAARYGSIYNFVMTFGGVSREVEDTPDHNRIQLMFLDEEFAKRFYKICHPQFELIEDVSVHFEYRGITGKLHFPIDVVLNSRHGQALVEIKPSIGDDYPAVLRQIRNNKCKFLLVSRFESIVASVDQFRNIFRNEGIRVIFLDEVVDGR